MKLTLEIATEISNRARLVLKRDIVISDALGHTLAGKTNPTSRYEVQVDALRSCQEGRVVRSDYDDTPIAWCPFVYESQTIGAFGVTEEEAQVTPEAISLLQGLAEVITHQHFLLEHVQPSEKMQADFFKQALITSKMDGGEVYRQADILQLNLRVPQSIMLVEIGVFERDLLQKHPHLPLEERSQRIAAAANAITGRMKAAFQNNSENIASYFGNDQFVLSKGIGGDGLTTRNTVRFLMEKAHYIHRLLIDELGSKQISIGVGQYYPDLGGLRKSYQEAKLALTVGTKVWGPGRVYHIKQVGMFVTLANVAQEHKAELAHQILYPLLRDEQLYKTVQTFLASGLNLTEAAEKLHVHRNTLIYRLDKTKKVIGLDPRVFDDALQIKLGLMFYQEEAV
jgi:carbohydrate diacid regulator